LKPSEIVRVFETYHRLLALLEPHEAVLWLIRPLSTLDEKTPCELLSTSKGYDDVTKVINDLHGDKPCASTSRAR
jgi:uncharacterized protein (DUF2384 family)